MKIKLFAIIGLVSAVLIAFLFYINDGSNEPTQHEAKDIKEMVNDYSVGNIKNQSASITSHQLLVTDSEGSQVSYDLPEEDFFVSIAPYFNETHP